MHVRRGQEERHEPGGVGVGSGAGGGRRRGGHRRRGRNDWDRLAAVEAAVAPTGGAGKRGGAVARGRHELAAAVEHVRAQPRCVVPQALPVPPLGRLRPHGAAASRDAKSGGRWGRGATAKNAIPRQFLVAPDLVLGAPSSLPLRPSGMELRLAVRRREAGRRERRLRDEGGVGRQKGPREGGRLQYRSLRGRRAMAKSLAVQHPLLWSTYGCSCCRGVVVASVLLLLVLFFLLVFLFFLLFLLHMR
uniref:Uncharacterized protein n=1 Tax=Arundo donax TaxID=35708 RepID=A0A0A9EVI6_ARUDO